MFASAGSGPVCSLVQGLAPLGVYNKYVPFGMEEHSHKILRVAGPDPLAEFSVVLKFVNLP